MYSGRDGNPSYCYLYYSKVDVKKVKRLIELDMNADVAIIKSKLEDLSELNRVLSSKDFCRRQSILSLLDEVKEQRCLSSELKCDNCKPFKLPMDRIMTNEVMVILTFLKQCPSIDVFSLRQILAGICHSCTSITCHAVEGLLKHWPLVEIAQFTDFLLKERLIVKKSYFHNGIPSHYLKVASNASAFIDGVEIIFGVFEVPLLNLFSGKKEWRSHCARFHALDKKRFYPKK